MAEEYLLHLFCLVFSGLKNAFFGRKGRFLRLFLTQYFWQRFLETLKNRVKAFLFSVHISYGKGKYLNQTVLFYKFAKT